MVRSGGGGGSFGGGGDGGGGGGGGGGDGGGGDGGGGSGGAAAAATDSRVVLEAHASRISRALISTTDPIFKRCPCSLRLSFSPYLFLPPLSLSLHLFSLLLSRGFVHLHAHVVSPMAVSLPSALLWSLITRAHEQTLNTGDPKKSSLFLPVSIRSINKLHSATDGSWIGKDDDGDRFNCYIQ